MIPDRVRRVLDFIAAKEAPRGYVDYYRGASFPPPKPLTEMTVDEVLAWQEAANPPGPGTAAAGRYQIIRKTLLGLKNTLGLTGREMFDEAMQDRMAYSLMLRRGWLQYASGDMTTEAIARNLAMEWASLPVLCRVAGAHRPVERGESYYAGDRINKALTSADQFEALLREFPATDAWPVPQPKPEPGFWAWLKALLARVFG